MGEYGPSCSCGLPLSRNPHPRAGEPEVLTMVGAVWVCIPCTVEALHTCSRRRYKAEEAKRQLLECQDDIVRHLGREEYGQVIEQARDARGHTGGPAMPDGDSALDLNEQVAMDDLLRAYSRIRGWRLRANGGELEQAVHVIQGFIIQHMLQRVNPDHWASWFMTDRPDPSRGFGLASEATGRDTDA